ncbi:hypothetical protein PM082_006384 [Marasmius tenuissimus]|nr:hypothetical protein PM082_006384 [Marasmius tenuissimus]
MQFSLILVALTAVATSVLAAPAIVEASFAHRHRAHRLVLEREPQADGKLFVCTDFYFSGQCANLRFFRNQCSNMPSGFQDNISSFGPDAGWECTTYTYVAHSIATYIDTD